MAVNINVPSQVRTFANLAAFPATGALKTIYIAEDTNKTYRWTGSVYVEVSASASGITIGTTAIASGVVGRVLFEGAGNVVQESSSLFWDATNNRLGIGTSSPLTTFHLADSTTAVSLLARSSLIASTLVASANNDVLIGLDIQPTFNNGAFTGVSNLGIRLNSEFLVSNGKAFTTSSGATANTGGFAGGQFFAVGNNTNNGYTAIQTFYSGVSFNAPLSINASGGNVLIGTTTNAGFKLDVNGTARVATSIVINGSASLLSSSLSIYQNSTNRAFSLATSTAKTSASERILFSLNSNDATNQQAMDFGYIGATLINDRYFYLQTSESSVGYGGGLAMQQNGGWASVGSATQVPSSVFHITSTTKGFLPPRMTTTQKNAIASPATGLMVYDTTLNVITYYNGTTWI